MASQTIKNIIQLSVGPDFRLLENQQIQLLLLKLVVLKKLGGKNKLSPKLKQMLDAFVKTRTTKCLRQSVCDKHFNSVQLDKILTEETGIPISAWGLKTENYVNKLTQNNDVSQLNKLLNQLETNIEENKNNMKMPEKEINRIEAEIAAYENTKKDAQEKFDKAQKQFYEKDKKFKKYGQDLQTLKDEVEGLESKNQTLLNKKYMNNKNEEQNILQIILDNSNIIDISGYITCILNKDLKNDIKQYKVNINNINLKKTEIKNLQTLKPNQDYKTEFEKTKLTLDNIKESLAGAILSKQKFVSFKKKIEEQINGKVKQIKLKDINQITFKKLPSNNALFDKLVETSITEQEVQTIREEFDSLRLTLNKLKNEKDNLRTKEAVESGSTVQDHIDFLTFLSQAAAGKKSTVKNKVVDNIRYDTMDNKTLNMITTKKSHKKFKNLRY